jgi:hypothetical protein
MGTFPVGICRVVTSRRDSGGPSRALAYRSASHVDRFDACRSFLELKEEGLRFDGAQDRRRASVALYSYLLGGLR